jgi:hypothetical protein
MEARGHSVLRAGLLGDDRDLDAVAGSAAGAAALAAVGAEGLEHSAPRSFSADRLAL